MNKDSFLRMLRNQPCWDDMIRRGRAGITVLFGGVEFLVFRDDALHYLRAVPQNATSVAVVRAFNTLMGSCRRELAKELEQWNHIRLTRDDNEGDR